MRPTSRTPTASRDLLKRVKPLYAGSGPCSRTASTTGLPLLLACFLAGLVLIIVRRTAGSTGFVVQPRRWVVERSLGWFGRWRRLSKDYEALPEVSEAMVTLAAIRLMLHRLAHPNRRRLPPPITSQTGTHPVTPRLHPCSCLLISRGRPWRRRPDLRPVPFSYPSAGEMLDGWNSHQAYAAMQNSGDLVQNRSAEYLRTQPRSASAYGHQAPLC